LHYKNKTKMQDINININNPKLEAILLNISKKNRKPIDNIVSEMLEKYINLYYLQEINKKQNSKNTISNWKNDFSKIGTWEINENQIKLKNWEIQQL